MEHESVNDSEMAFLNNPVMTNIKGGEIKEDTDEDIIIEEFDDWWLNLVFPKGESNTAKHIFSIQFVIYI